MVETSQLPPLILHPFSGAGTSNELLDGSKASLTLHGLGVSGTGTLPDGHAQAGDVDLFRRVLIGRYQEIRMLLFLGKDLFRWTQQCVDFVGRSGAVDVKKEVKKELKNEDPRKSQPLILEQSFAALVVENPPAALQVKLQKWGVSDRKAIFSRAIGINSLFSSPPPVDFLSPMFLQHYHRYADHAYICFQHLKPYHALDARQFAFEMYASEEYARLLSEQWQRM